MLEVIDELEGNMKALRGMEQQLKESIELEKLNDFPELPIIFKSPDGKIIRKRKGKNPCDVCGRGTISRYTDNSGNARATKTFDRMGFRIRIYEHICPHSHIKHVMNIEKKEGLDGQ